MLWVAQDGLTYERSGAWGRMAEKVRLADGLKVVAFEDAVGALNFADVAGDVVDLGVGEAGDGEHVAELPVVLADAAKHGDAEGGIRVVAGVVDPVIEGRAL